MKTFKKIVKKVVKLYKKKCECLYLEWKLQTNIEYFTRQFGIFPFVHLNIGLFLWFIWKNLSNYARCFTLNLKF